MRFGQRLDGVRRRRPDRPCWPRRSRGGSSAGCGAQSSRSPLSAVRALRPARCSAVTGCRRAQRRAPAATTRTILLSGCWAVSVLPGGLSVEPELLCAGARRAESIAHDSRPQTPRGTELRDLFEEIVVRVEEERDTLPDYFDVEPAFDGGVHVGAPVRQRERHFLNGRRAGFADVIPADRDRVPVRHLTRAEPYDIGHDA